MINSVHITRMLTVLQPGSNWPNLGSGYGTMPRQAVGLFYNHFHKQIQGYQQHGQANTR